MIKEIKTLYPTKIHIAYELTKEEYDSVFDDNKYDEINDMHESGSDGLTIAGKNVDKLNCVVMSFDENYEYDTIIHECYHAANNIWNFIGAKHDVDNDEPFAYLLSYLSKECRKFLNKIEDGNKD